MTESRIALQGMVRGLVQGVFFRAETQRRAQQLGVNGWVRNTRDGHVEVYLCGEPGPVEDLVAWLQQGPARARVAAVDLRPAPCQELQEFEIRS